MRTFVDSEGLPYIGEHVLTLEDYFVDFVSHDSRHREQIELIR